MASNAANDKMKEKKQKVKFPCGNCSKTTSGCLALMCNICELWHHVECVPGFTSEMYQSLFSMKESLGYSFYLCPKCEKVHKKTWQAISKINVRLDNVESRLESIEKLLKGHQAKQEAVAKKVDQVEKKSSKI